MGLSTDSIFIAALSASDDIMEAVGGRIYDTAIPLPDEEAENTPVPYIIVTFDSLQNDQTTKDDRYESEYDKVDPLHTTNGVYGLGNAWNNALGAASYVHMYIFNFISTKKL